MFGMGKAQRLSLTMQVEAQLKGALMVGMLKPGARLVTSEIAAQLGTSVTPVREALLRLVSAGALEATPAKAFLVPVMPLSQYQEITLIRKQLEGLAAAQAARAMDADKLAHLTALNSQFRSNKMVQNIEESLKANREFRFTLYGYADMPTLVSLIEQLWVQIGPCFNYLYPQSAEIVHRQHNYDELLLALAEGDSERCVKSIHKAIDDGVSILEKNYFHC
ncbi:MULTISPECIES: FCD domain-containing protein [unclassified Brenneria]|uniref:FCD domain-containing protein n=1 Tax=unclassified Brenneria TaxID=2634434 RepID=UPI0029C14CEC|nr:MULTISPECIES: FCD domain-containing protein [unclassified Brenneria]MDX5630389.1 FCD domain-containing protein [Brenneria sp. L3-3Z]MDX5697534.1 FCD domain-containing protein [Brenneria sp. L4-2C]MEE3662483.1 FCD domain-containing protein [Brenneria sp. g21c3]